MSPWWAPAWWGCPWPTSWPAWGRASRSSTPAIPGGPPTPGRASCRRSRARRPIPTCGRSCARPGGTTRLCWPGWRPTAPRSTRRATAAAASSPSACARREEEWFAPFAELVLRRSPGEVVEITPEEASSLFPPLGPVHRVLHAPASARVDGRGMAAALRQAAAAPWRGLRHGRGPRRGGRERAARATWRRSRSKGTRTWPAAPSPSPGAPGRRRSASGSARACPSVRPRGRSCISASGRRRGSGPSSSRCSPTTSCPGPAGGWPAAARSRPPPASPSA